MSNSAQLELREWDSEFFGLRIARLHATRLKPGIVKQTLAWCTEHQVRCLYFLADSDDPITTLLAQQHGFHLVDVRMTLERSCEHPPPQRQLPAGVVIREAIDADNPALRAIAHVSHRDTRFYFDGRFGIAKCDELYEVWIEKSCNGFADCVYAATINGEIAGYITCSEDAQQQGQIGLVGVAEFARGRGLGPALVEQAIRWSAGRGLPRITVVTQGRNLAAQRTYQRCGFLTHQVQLWYHRWFE